MDQKLVLICLVVLFSGPAAAQVDECGSHCIPYHHDWDWVEVPDDVMLEQCPPPSPDIHYCDCSIYRPAKTGCLGCCGSSQFNESTTGPPSDQSTLCKCCKPRTQCPIQPNPTCLVIKICPGGGGLCMEYLEIEDCYLESHEYIWTRTCACQDCSNWRVPPLEPAVREDTVKGRERPPRRKGAQAAFDHAVMERPELRKQLELAGVWVPPRKQ